MQLRRLFGKASEWRERAGAAMPEAVTQLSDDDRPRAAAKQRPVEKRKPQPKGASLKRPAKKDSRAASPKKAENQSEEKGPKVRG